MDWNLIPSLDATRRRWSCRPFDGERSGWGVVRFLDIFYLIQSKFCPCWLFDSIFIKAGGNMWTLQLPKAMRRATRRTLGSSRCLFTPSPRWTDHHNLGLPVSLSTCGLGYRSRPAWSSAGPTATSQPSDRVVGRAQLARLDKVRQQSSLQASSLSSPTEESTVSHQAALAGGKRMPGWSRRRRWRDGR